MNMAKTDPLVLWPCLHCKISCHTSLDKARLCAFNQHNHLKTGSNIKGKCKFYVISHAKYEQQSNFGPS